jgi:hypothetical protein
MDISLKSGGSELWLLEKSGEFGPFFPMKKPFVYLVQNQGFLFQICEVAGVVI